MRRRYKEKRGRWRREGHVGERGACGGKMGGEERGRWRGEVRVEGREVRVEGREAADVRDAL